MRTLLSLALLALTGCGIIVPKMRDTRVSSSSTSYSKLSEEATKLGWQAEQAPDNKPSREGKYFWMLKVTPTSGGVLYFTRNNLSGNVSFTCADLKKRACNEAANQLFQPAFGGVYQ